MKSPKVKGIGEVVTEYGAKVMKIFKKGLLQRSLFDFYGDVKANAIRVKESSSVPQTPVDKDGGVVYVKNSDGKLYYKSNEVSEIELSASDANTQNTTTLSFVDSSNDILLRNTTGGAGSGTDDIKFVAGSNVTLTHTDADNITIASTDTNTTYSIQDGELSKNNFTDADHTKLNGIEASADVTDATNVTAAGALMDSELTDLAGVKGVTISTLQVKPSEGAFANGDKTKLDSIAANATADQTNVTGSSGSCTGNAATATALATARAINGVNFDGSAPITITAAGSTLSDTVTVAKGGTGRTSLADNSLLTGNGTSGIIAESNLTYDGTNLTMTSDAIAAPDLIIQSTVSHPTAGNLIFNKFRDDDTPPDGMTVGLIQWNSEDDANNTQIYAQVIGSAEETGSGTEGGKLQLKIATHDGELKDGIVIEDGNAEDEIDVTIGQGTSSLTTIAGNLDVTGNIDLPGIVRSGISAIKILPSDFIPDDVGRPAQIDDVASNKRFLKSHSTAKLYASIDIPLGFKATAVDVFGSGTSAMSVHVMSITSGSIAATVGNGNIGTTFNFSGTPVNGSSTNYLLIELAQASTEQVFGGAVTIAKI